VSRGAQPGRCTAISAWYAGFVVITGLVFASAAAAAGPCEDAAAARDVGAALNQIEASIDPCGESAEILKIVGEFRTCAGLGYRICRDRDSARNFIEPGLRAAGIPTTITWNPELRTELERGCGEDSQQPVLRDPVASLLHEVAHAVQDCHGLDPTQHEFEAVRIENIYRRARGLCQRTRYGDEHLPVNMTVPCEPGNCRCAPLEDSLRTAANDRKSPATAGSVSEAAGDLAAPSFSSAER
jgi:hypothetical protein